MNLFLQAAYKVVEVPVHSCYDIGKDYIMPVIGSILAFLFAYLIMCFQHYRTVKAEEMKELKSKSDFEDFIFLTIDKVLAQNKEMVSIFLNYLSDFKFEKKHVMSRYLIPQSGLKTIMKIDESKIHWVFSEKSKQKEFRKSLNVFFTTLYDLKDTFSQFNITFEEFKIKHDKITEDINLLFSEFYKEFDLLIQSDKVDPNNILIIKDGWLDKELIKLLTKFKEVNNDISNLLLIENLIIDIFDFVRPTGVKEQDALFLQNYIVEIKIKLGNLKNEYMNFTNNIGYFKTIVMNSDKELQSFRNIFK